MNDNQDNLRNNILSDEIKSISEQLEEPNRTMPEWVFKDNFLPYFSGKEPISDESTILQSWVGLSGGYNKPVDIINEVGSVIITVPPIFNADSYTPSTSSDISLGDMVRMINTAPSTLSDPEPYEKLVIKTTNDNIHDSGEIQDGWSKVLAHYGVSAGITDTISIKDEEDDFLDYD